MTEMYFAPEPQSQSRPERTEVVFRERAFLFWTDHGVFSRGELDRGTETLLKALPASMEGAALDLGCGWGPIGIILCGLNPGLRAVLSDVNARAVELTARNIRENHLEERCEALCSDGFARIEGRFDHILCNPPIRAGKEVIYALFAEAARHLNPGGHLYIVIRKQQGAASCVRYLKTLFSATEEIDKSGGYWIIRCGEALEHDHESVF